MSKKPKVNSVKIKPFKVRYLPVKQIVPIYPPNMLKAFEQQKQRQQKAYRLDRAEIAINKLARDSGATRQR